MNYYPYSNIPYITSTPKVGLFKNLFGGLNLSSFLNGTQKTLSVINQAIPLIKQAGPMLNNAKTMFKVMNEFKKTEIIESPVNSVQNIEKIEKTYNTGPTFFQ